MTTLSNSADSKHIAILDDEGNALPFQTMSFYVGIDPSACYCNRHISDNILMCELAYNVDIDVKCKNGISINGRWPNINIKFNDAKIGMVRSLKINDTNETGKFAHIALDMAVDLP